MGGVQGLGTDAEGCRDAEVVRVDLVHLRNFSMGSNLNPAHKVLDQMAARNLFSNFAKKFGGVDLFTI